VDRIQEVLREEGISATVSDVNVDDASVAQEIGFLGSPSIRVSKPSIRDRQVVEVRGDRLPCVIVDADYGIRTSQYTFWIATDSGLVLRRVVTLAWISTHWAKKPANVVSEGFVSGDAAVFFFSIETVLLRVRECRIKATRRPVREPLHLDLLHATRDPSAAADIIYG
jgi:hypothetical protein